MPPKVKRQIEDSKKLRDFKIRNKGRMERKRKHQNRENNKYISADHPSLSKKRQRRNEDDYEVVEKEEDIDLMMRDEEEEEDEDFEK